MSNRPGANQNFFGARLQSVGFPVNDNDAATKAWVLAQIATNPGGGGSGGITAQQVKVIARRANFRYAVR